MAVILFAEREDCCGCGACQNACPRDAISMVADEDGFSYPRIDPVQCVECGACKKACGYQNIPRKTSQIACYAAAAQNEEILKRSASGGVFAILAENTLKNNGVVYGVAMQLQEGELIARHTRIDAVSDIPVLQGSKYVQSDTGLVYRQAKDDLQNGKQVLFSGTPCQIAGLYAYLGKNYENLLTVEVICHGVPNGNMFRDFLRTLGEKNGAPVVRFSFRTKNKGQGKNVCVEYRKADGTTYQKNGDGTLYSYMLYFQKSLICRSSCYRCPFATAERVADVTLGDYWGFHEEHPVLPSDVQLSNAKGVSCVLVNTEQGRRKFEECRTYLTVLESRRENIAKHNMQLCRPCAYRSERDVIMQLYREEGYNAVERHYQKTCQKERLAGLVLGVIPKGLKRTVKRVIGLLR